MKSIREIMSGRPVASILPDATVLEAAMRMREAKVGALLVLDAQGAACGMFTERDLMLRVVVDGLDVGETAVGSVMTRDLYTTTPERRINDVAREMQARHIRHLPILEDGQVVGMLSLRDLLNEHLEVKRDEVKALTSYIQGEGEGPTAAGG